MLQRTRLELLLSCGTQFEYIHEFLFRPAEPIVCEILGEGAVLILMSRISQLEIVRRLALANS